MVGKMAKEIDLRQLGIGVASLTFGVALSIFIYAAASGLLNGSQALLLYATSFLLMLRFWWRYTELFIRFLPSKNFWQFLFDFAISFFGILAVLFVGSIQTWALLGSSAMVASMIRCGLSWRDARSETIRKSLKRTIIGAVLMFMLLSAVYLLAPFVSNLALAAIVFVSVFVFVAYASAKP